MFKKLILAFAAAMTFGSISAPAQAAPQQTGISNTSFDREVEVDHDCREQLQKQWPSWFKNVGLSALRQAIPSTIGAYFGGKQFEMIGSPIKAKNYAVNNIAVVGGAGIGAGIQGYETGKHTSVAQCVAGFVRRASRELGREDMKDIDVLFNTFQVNGHAVRGPNGEKLGKGDYFVVTYHPHPLEQALPGYGAANDNNPAAANDNHAVASGDDDEDVATTPPGN